MSRSKKWVFTLNNYTEEEVLTLKNLDVKYIGFGFEVGEQGTPHLQGFVWFKKQLRLKAAKAIMGTERVHLETQRGDLADNLNYCTKETGQFWQSGPPPVEKSKTPYCDIVKMSLQEADKIMLEEHTWASGSSNWQRLRASMIKPYIGEMDVRWFYGPTGTGKTRTAVEMGGRVIEFDGKFFNYRGGEECVVLDEVDKTVIPLSTMLRLLDRYEYHLRVLGGYVPRDFNKIIITSTVHPSCVYNEHFEQIERRISEIKEFN